MMNEYQPDTLKNLLDGKLDDSEVLSIMSSKKDGDRFQKMIAIYQERVSWKERILLPYGEALFIVEDKHANRTVKCECGHDFGDYKKNWKLSAIIYVRNTEEEIHEIYPKMLGCDPNWMELREFYCPSCKRQLDVEVVTPGYPIVFDFEPDLEAFYKDWLGISL